MACFGFLMYYNEIKLLETAHFKENYERFKLKTDLGSNSGIQYL